jgi:hypothetical protein
MASEVQTIVEPARNPDAEAPFGERDDKILKASFPMSPVMYTDDPDRRLTDNGLRNSYYDAIKDYSKITPKIRESPDMVKVAEKETGGEGKPAIGKTKGNPETGEVAQMWPVPNIGSSFNSNSSTGAAPGFQEDVGRVQLQKSINYGSGPSQPSNPNKTTRLISRQDFRLGRLTLGSSS